MAWRPNPLVGLRDSARVNSTARLRSGIRKLKWKTTNPIERRNIFHLPSWIGWGSRPADETAFRPAFLVARRVLFLFLKNYFFILFVCVPLFFCFHTQVFHSHYVFETFPVLFWFLGDLFSFFHFFQPSFLSTFLLRSKIFSRILKDSFDILRATCSVFLVFIRISGIST